MCYILTGDIGRQIDVFDTWHRKINKKQILCLELSRVAYQLTTQILRVYGSKAIVSHLQFKFTTKLAALAR